MQGKGQYLAVVSDFTGNNNQNFLQVSKGDIVRVIKKELEWFTVEKDGKIGKVPKSILRALYVQPSIINLNLTEQSLNTNQDIADSMKTPKSDRSMHSLKEKHTPQSISFNQVLQNRLQELYNEQIKEIITIIEQNNLNIDQKKVKIKEIFIELKQKDLIELMKIFDLDALNYFQAQIFNCETQSKLILLFILEQLTEIGYQQFMQNPFFNDFQQSGLLNIIQTQLNRKSDILIKQSQISPPSEEILILMRIYLNIMNCQTNAQLEILDICIKIIEMNIIYIMDNFLIQQQQMQKQAIMNKNKINTELQQISKTIRTIGQFTSILPNYLFGKVPDSIFNLFRFKILRTLHINCPAAIQCQFRVSIQTTSEIHDFQSAIFEAYANIIYGDSDLIDFLVHDQDILPHLIIHIVSFADQNQIVKIQHQKQQQQQFISLSLISSIIHLLSNLLDINQSNCNQASKTPHLLQSLIKLIISKYNDCHNYEDQQATKTIKSYSLECLSRFHKFGDVNTQIILSDSGYVNALVIFIGQCGASLEQSNTEITNALLNASNFFNSLHQGRNSSYFPPLPFLAKQSDEQLEEEGGNEEIGAQMANQKFDIKSVVNETWKAILNFFAYQPNWQNQDDENNL